MLEILPVREEGNVSYRHSDSEPFNSEGKKSPAQQEEFTAARAQLLGEKWQSYCCKGEANNGDGDFFPFPNLQNLKHNLVCAWEHSEGFCNVPNHPKEKTKR